MTNESRTRWRDTWRAMVVVVVAGFIIAGLLFVVLKPSGMSEIEANCTADVEAKQKREMNVVSATLLPREQKPLRFDGKFGPQRREKENKILLDWSSDTAPAIQLGQMPKGQVEDLILERGEQPGLVQGDTLALLWSRPSRVEPDDDAPYRSSRIGITATVVESGVAVDICLGATGVKPGRYTTVIQFQDPSIEASPIQLDVLLKEHDLREPGLAILAGVLVASLMIIGRWHVLKADGKGPELATLIIGTTLAVFSVFFTSIAMWNSDATWGDNELLDPFALVYTTMMGIIGSAALGEAAPNAARGLRDALEPDRSGGSESAVEQDHQQPALAKEDS